ncbi:ATP-dependent DNA helicase RecG [Thiomicrospira sp. R3]|uniref:ATP-dependent DNA helicase RecG n=1 Tax=Thiomicrospira sp. R3 TaxID=3035472 RepID=UPI00259B8CE2|nr:ATP-dependent DNA helicase RecG [Thiomicrospira sp. R3]WFE69662.1 ATP-dependent DNA helicase RecG [Thiomicrospira sp. R3]
MQVTALKGVGEKQAEKLARLGLHVVQDLLFHLPHRYQDKTKITPLNQAIIGQEVLIEASIKTQRLTQGRRPTLLVELEDDSGTQLGLRFFHFQATQARQFKRGNLVRAFGELRSGLNGLEIVHPHYNVFSTEAPPLETTLTPVYPTTEGLGQITLVKLIKQALALLKQYPLIEGLNQAWLSRWQLPAINEALLTLHQPQPSDDLSQIKQFEHPAQARLIVEELITQQLSLQLLRQQQIQRIAPHLPASQTANALLTSLPFTLTSAQQRVWQEIADDLKQSKPMQRLVQGDVGSGKTIIAALAALQAADADYQVAIMAPTEILAEQHRNHFAEWLAPLNIEMAWLNGRLKVGEKRKMLAKIVSGDAKIAVGTHALFQEAVEFNRLGLVIIDEQHRFGVHQRLTLNQKAKTKEIENFAPHQLTLTATPIPRTLAMTAYGDLDISVIDALPPGRLPVDTAVLGNQKRHQVMAHLYHACKDGVQAYWVCPLIDESELLDAQAAQTTFDEFKQLWPDMRVGLVHGRLKAAEKELVMQQFKAHELDLLVATTVIEVGVNVPNASLMIIENAERLGLSQLHQLRGRVGRGAKKSHCVLLYQSPLSASAKARLQIMRQTNDGFVIAEEDLRIRGPGEVLGTRQTGGMTLRIADIQRDQAWIEPAQQAATQMLEQASLQNSTEEIELLQQRWIGEKVEYKHA